MWGMSLKIRILGQFKLQAGDRPLEMPSRPAQSLLAYLALNAGVSHRRERLASLLWPDSTDSNARGYLRQALWRIRKHFEASGVGWQDYLAISDINVSFKSEADYWLDAQQLLQSADNLSLGELIGAVELYQGELLPGFYDEWVLVERDRIQAAYSNRMGLLLERLIEAGRWDDVLYWGEEWIRLGHAPEPAFRALLAAHAAMGDQTMASATYQRCVDALDRELGLDPSPQTRQLYEQILRGEQSITAAPTTVADRPMRQPAFLDAGREPIGERPLFVAREKELARLESYLDQAEDGRGRVVFVTGEIGSGKSALIEEFTGKVLAERDDLIVAGGNCNAHTGIGDPYLPFREILELLSGDVEALWTAGAISGQHARRLWHTLPFTVEALLESSPDLVGTFIAGKPLADRATVYESARGLGRSADDGQAARLQELVRDKASTSSGQGPEQRDLFEQCVKVLQALSRRAVLVLVVDDLQWADLGSISLLFHLGRYIDRSSILILGAYRPEEVALGRDGERHPLQPLINEFQRDFGDIIVNLGQAEGRPLVKAILDSEPNRLGNSFREMLYRQTMGQPLFTLELLRGMQERGDLIREADGYWVEGPALDWQTLPARVEAVVAERIGRLARPLRDILRVASVEGETFTAEVLAQVSESPPKALLANLSGELDRRHRLIQAQSIVRVDGRLVSRYRFRHILFQRYLYSSLDQVEQVHLHESVGLALEELYGSQQETMAVAVQLARHFQQAGIIEKAIYYLHRAGDKAIHLSACPEGIIHLNSALALLSELPDTPERTQKELALQISLIMAMKGTIPEPEWEEVLGRARELCQLTGNTIQWCQVLGELSIRSYVRAQYQQAIELAQEALDLALEAGDPLLIPLCQWQLGYNLFGAGEFEAAQENFAHMLAFYDPQRHHHDLVALRGSDPGSGAMAYAACSLWCLGYPDQARQSSQESLALAQKLGHKFSKADVLCFGGCLVCRLSRDAETLKIHADALVQLSTESDYRSFAPAGICHQGVALAELGRLQEGLKLMRQGLDRRESMGVGCYSTDVLGAIAEVQMKSGQLEEGLGTLSEALAMVEETGERYFEAELHRLQAELLLRKPDEAAAEESLQRAIEIARRQKARSWELRATTDLARLWQGQGKVAAARDALQRIYDWFQEGFDTPDLVEARALLDELS